MKYSHELQAKLYRLDAQYLEAIRANHQALAFFIKETADEVAYELKQAQFIEKEGK